jgi:hypothetical protein
MTGLALADDDARFDAGVKKFAKLSPAERRARIERKLFAEKPRRDLSKVDIAPLMEQLRKLPRPEQLKAFFAHQYFALSRRDLAAAVRSDPKGFAALHDQAKALNGIFGSMRLIDALRPVLAEVVGRLDDAVDNSEFLADLGL